MLRDARASRTVWLTAFGIAFGIVEGAVVVYLRALYYPNGFEFPLMLPEFRLLGVELVREFATLVILAAVARAAGRSGWDSFGVFCFLFGVWDLVYYLMLWTVLGWPENLLTWDVLFLLPLVWVGPVLSAALIAGCLVVGGLWIMRSTAGGRPPRPDRWSWAGSLVALLLLLGSFMAHHGTVRAGVLPDSFPWLPYGVGVGLGWLALVRALRPASESSS